MIRHMLKLVTSWALRKGILFRSTRGSCPFGCPIFQHFRRVLNMDARKKACIFDFQGFRLKFLRFSSMLQIFVHNKSINVET